MTDEITKLESEIDASNIIIKQHEDEIKRQQNKIKEFQKEILEKKKQLPGLYCIEMNDQSTGEIIHLGCWSRCDLIGDIDRTICVSDYSTENYRIKNIFKENHIYDCIILYRSTSLFRPTTLNHIDCVTDKDFMKVKDWDVAYLYDEFELGASASASIG